MFFLLVAARRGPTIASVIDERAQPDARADRGKTGSRSRWFPVAILLLVALFTVVVLQRNHIRAHWWAYRLTLTEDLDLRGYYLASLSAVGESGAGATRRLARHEDPDVRLLAIFALNALPEGERISELRRLLHDSDLDVREAAALALVFVGSAESTAILCETAVAKAADSATAAVAALGRSNDPRAKQTLCSVLRDHPRADVRAQAAESLGGWLDMIRDDSDHSEIRDEALGCEGIAALVDALSDEAIFSGPLLLERQIADAAQAMNRPDVSGGFSCDVPPPDEPRSVAQIAAAAMSRLTGMTVRPSPEPATPTSANLAEDSCRLYRQQAARRHGRIVPQSVTPDSSDTSPVRD